MEKLADLMKDGWSYPLPQGVSKEYVDNLINEKLGGIANGTAGQFVVSNGNGGVMLKTLVEVAEVAY